MDPQNPPGSAHTQQSRTAPVYDTNQGGHYGKYTAFAYPITSSALPSCADRRYAHLGACAAVSLPSARTFTRKGSI